MFWELCGETSLKNAVLMTNMWGGITPETGEAREQELKNKYFRAAVEKGAQLRRHYNTPESARMVLRDILKNQPIVLKVQRELIYEGKEIGRTGAGAELDRKIHEMIRKYQEKIGMVEEELRRADTEEEEETRKDLEMEKRKMQVVMEELREDLAGMNAKFEGVRREMGERIKVRFGHG